VRAEVFADPAVDVREPAMPLGEHVCGHRGADLGVVEADLREAVAEFGGLLVPDLDDRRLRRLRSAVVTTSALGNQPSAARTCACSRSLTAHCQPPTQVALLPPSIAGNAITPTLLSLSWLKRSQAKPQLTANATWPALNSLTVRVS